MEIDEPVVITVEDAEEEEEGQEEQTVKHVTKRKWRSGTVAKREVAKLSRTTNSLFPRAQFLRSVQTGYVIGICCSSRTKT